MAVLGSTPAGDGIAGSSMRQQSLITIKNDKADITAALTPHRAEIEEAMVADSFLTEVIY